MSDDPEGPDDAAPTEELETDGVDEKHVEPGPNVDAMSFWEEVLEDMEATAAEYRQEGWEVLEIHPGDVTVRPEGERIGLDVLVPDDEFDRLQSLVADDVTFDGYQVYRADQEGLVFVVVAMEDAGTETAVVYPAYYDTHQPDTNDMLDHARQEGELRSYLRILQGEYVEFALEDPSLFVPEDE
jgi:hypothetical protein